MSARVCKSFKVLVGLEIHVQLATQTKMFTAAPNGATHFGADPNSLVNPVILGLPGVLPVMNKAAVESSIKVGLALGCQIAKHTKWDRKSYYYPDLPKNYQISQYDEPLCGPGVFELEDETGQIVPIRIRRAHLEEDAGKLLHEAPGGFRIDHSIVDLNRAGTPLLEIVTEPDFTTAKQVALFAQELQKLVQFLGVSEGQMQMGHMRFEPNINVHITDDKGVVHKTAITEVKNLNSFSVVERATAFELQRQIHAWEDTGTLGKKSTYGWDENAGATYWQRDKEDADDYRYFPDPDLMPVEVSDEWLNELKSQVGELPRARRKRYESALGLNAKDAAILAGDRATGDYFEQILAAGADARRASTLMETLREIANERGTAATAVGVAPTRLAEIAGLVAAGKLAGNKETAKTIIASLAEQDRSAEQAAASLGLIQSTDTGEVDRLVDELIAENPKSLQDYRGGKQQARGALIGMIMKKAKGLNAKIVGERLDAKVK
ncbi:Asp-tRNA(Asn)/Glu-tRNA(Gln) amidotransferase subunit GatB [Humisphaera borealis]|uniref:Aspartyl/glutamyl-tRNA(Asn/Gln) amidotransferase subunit B n=1 Tax=Humisphaera borealis TaxID=2807512 RepID=A0A7M2WT01_9BACT|nr:Asp-tRNA(Asn)/Glu-tRNA(Gln) amidotransferase subunit GatB [Humisphaera borealis]QOV87730.1 Asp-tRNA(Asn)/Glu-tRNA(Gln) amidotransferase subunit GatB [Humisphaera borealis]